MKLIIGIVIGAGIPVIGLAVFLYLVAKDRYKNISD